MAEITPCCYDCLTTDVTIKVIDLCGFEHWFCGPCWAGYEDLHDKITTMLSDAADALAPPAG